MLEVHVKAGSDNVAQWFTEPIARFDTLPEAVRWADNLLMDTPMYPGDAGVRDVVIVDMRGNAFDETGAPCELPEALVFDDDEPAERTL